MCVCPMGKSDDVILDMETEEEDIESYKRKGINYR